MAGALLINSSSGPSTFAATLNRSFLTGFAYAPGSAQTSQSVKCTASGGVPPYTYAWTKVGTSDISPTAAVGQTTYFSLYGTTEDTQSDSFICTVTDSTAAIAVSPAVTVNLTLIGS